MAKYLSNRQRNLNVGITSYTENLTVLEVTGGAYVSGNLGIGTTNPTQSIDIQGSARLTGALYDSTDLAGIPGQILQTTGSGIIWTNASDVSTVTYATNAGIATYATNSGIATYATNSGIATYATNSGIATYATNSGIATYATNSGIATYATNSGIATYATNSGIATYATNSGIATYATNSGIATYATNSGIATYATNSGIATYATNAGVSTNVIGGIGSITELYVSGISTLGTVEISSGIVTATVGVVTYYGDGSKLTDINATSITGIIGYAHTAGVSTNVIGGIGSITELYVSGISTLGTVEISSGIVTATVGVVTYYGDGSKLTDINATSITGIIGYAHTAGIATYATNSGIATYATNSGIATYATNAGVSTYATNSGIATYAINSGIATYAINSGIATYATNAGVSTNVIGGIGSITELQVNGISTLGTVEISSGIVTATVGVVTYYGDGSKLTGIQTSGVVSIINQEPVSSPVYPTLVNNVGLTSLGISTTKLSFIPSTGKLGLGTETPRENLDVIGTIGIQSAGTSNRFYLQHNSSQNSLDFIFV